MADTSTYPATPDGDLRALVAPGTTPSGFEDFMQLVADAVAKIETELGTNPSGASTDVAARVTADEAGLAAHLADTADAHDASTISIVDTGGHFTGSDVEAALQELGAGGGSTVDVVSNVAQDRILGRVTAGAGDSEELTAAQVANMLGLLPYSGAKVSRAAGQTGVVSGVDAAISWTTEDWDEGAWFAAGSPTRLTVPADVTRIEAKFNISYAGSAAGRRITRIRKNGATNVARDDRHPVEASGPGPTVVQISVDEDVVVGDYFEFYVFQDTGGTITVGADICWASIRRIDG